jgi:hypothetical protein
VSAAEPDEPRDDEDGIEVFAAGPWSNVSPLATLWGSNAVLGERPDWATAATYLTRAMERHRSAADVYAKALLMDVGIAELNRATEDLEGSISALGFARLMLRDESERPPWSIGSDTAYGDDEWLDDNLDVEDTTPSEAEVPVAVELGTVLHDGHVSVRTRQALVYSTGFVLTLDIAMRAPTDFTREERHAVDTAFNDLAEKISVDPASGLEASPHSGWCRVFHRSAVGWGEVWVEGEPAGGPIEFRLSDLRGGRCPHRRCAHEGHRRLRAR